MRSSVRDLTREKTMWFLFGYLPSASAYAPGQLGELGQDPLYPCASVSPPVKGELLLKSTM